jgi:IS30 family transposase
LEKVDVVGYDINVMIVPYTKNNCVSTLCEKKTKCLIILKLICNIFFCLGNVKLSQVIILDVF